MATDTADAATDMATDATDAATDMATDTAEAATDAATDTAAAATDMAEDAAGGFDIASLLTPETFDADKISEWIDTQEFGPLVSTPLKAAVEAAGDNPDMISGVIDQIKEAAGL